MADQQQLEQVKIDDTVEIGTLFCIDGYYKGVLYTLRNKSNYSREILITSQEPREKFAVTETILLEPHSFRTYVGATCMHMKILN